MYFLISVLLQLVEVKYDFAMPIGLDHRCVHCTMKKEPFLDEHGHPTSYQQDICEMIAFSSPWTASELDNILL